MHTDFCSVDFALGVPFSTFETGNKFLGVMVFIYIIQNPTEIDFFRYKLIKSELPNAHLKSECTGEFEDAESRLEREAAGEKRKGRMKGRKGAVGWFGK